MVGGRGGSEKSALEYWKIIGIFFQKRHITDFNKNLCRATLWGAENEYDVKIGDDEAGLRWTGLLFQLYLYFYKNSL